jgi:AraC-like DNA-binding protein
MNMAPIRFLHGAYIPACDHVISKEFSGYYTLQYMDAGTVDLSVGGERHVLNGRWFWSAYPGPQIAFRAGLGQRTWVHRYLAFRGKGVERWIREGIFPIAPQRPGRGTDYAARFDELLALSVRQDHWGQRRAVHCMEAILLELAEERATGGQEDTWATAATGALEACVIGEDPDYDQLAERLGMSISTLRRRFRQAMGTSPHDYLLGLRVATARRLLAETALPLKEIARRLGYRDVFYFSRQFTKIAGVPPTVYRHSARG